MARKFSDKEKEFYKKKIISEASKLFAQYGFNKTSIQDITDAAGIAKGTLYIFFNSKEEVLFSVFEELEQFRDKIFQDLQKPGIDAGDAIQQLITQSLRFVEDNKIFKMMNDENIIDKMMLKLPEERLAKHHEKDETDSREFIKYLQTSSNLIDTKPEIIVGLLRALFMITLHKKEIGFTIYDEVIELLTRAVARGLRKE
ncbi:MAG: TetR/AcrR family transcriptional regulator [Candidatus Marinimicrobia bacterium]|nr:TetR/AcrR family transcriptional regulator [Candidatus Neomarinimicrobiota bacterium]